MGQNSPVHTPLLYNKKIYQILYIFVPRMREKGEKMSHSPTHTKMCGLIMILYVGHAFKSTTKT